MRLSARSTIYVLAMAASLGLAACGGDDGGSLPEPEGEHHTFVVDSVTIPLDADEAEELGFDIDGDGTVDNQLGNILSALIQAGGGDLDLQGSITESVNSGEILLLADIQATALTSAAACGFSLYLGENPSPAPCTNPDDPLTCRQHLDGTGTFDVDPSSPPDVTVRGNIVGGRFTGGPGDLALQIAFGETAINLTLIEARAEINGITDTGFEQSKVGGAVPDEVIQNEVLPAVSVAVNDIMTEDCPAPRTPPTCGCMDGSTGETLMGIFDENGDCDVPETEVRENSLIVTLLRPDVDTDGDDEPDSLSVGVGATAVAGTWTVPE
jgi:hypothetical protein